MSVAPAENYASEGAEIKVEEVKSLGKGPSIIIADKNRRRSERGMLILAPPEKKESAWKRALNIWSGRLRPLLESFAFRVTLVACLIFALFGGGLFVMFDIPDDPGIPILDALMIVVMVLFVLEMVINGVVDYKTYPLSFFFWMDALGTVSMIFEISTLLGPGGKMQTTSGGVDATLIRVARVAKVGARVGRLSKLMKCISYYLKDKDKRLDLSQNPAEAKKLSGRLMLTLSTKVSLLTILLVLAIPLFSIAQYPEQDLSMLVWGNKLEADYQRSYSDLNAAPSMNTTSLLEDSVQEMMTFYDVGTANYFPYRLDAFTEEVTLPDGRQVTIPGASLLASQAAPRQLSDVMRITVKCKIDRPGWTCHISRNRRSQAVLKCGSKAADFGLLAQCPTATSFGPSMDGNASSSGSSIGEWIRTLNSGGFLSLSDDMPAEEQDEQQQAAASSSDPAMPVQPEQAALAAALAAAHAEGTCVPCVFHPVTGGCLKGQTCTYCHLAHPDVRASHTRRVRKQTRDSIKRRVLPLFRPPLDLQERHDALQEEAATHEYARRLIIGYLEDPERVAQDRRALEEEDADPAAAAE
eukprot:s3871_g4.t8